MRHKEQVNAQDQHGNTALHMACKYFHLGLVESILGKINNTRYSERFFVTAFKLLEGESQSTDNTCQRVKSVKSVTLK